MIFGEASETLATLDAELDKSPIWWYD